MNGLEIAGTLLGLLYLYFEFRASVWLWPVSIIMPAVYIVVYYQAGLYADLGISVYYVGASVYGLIYWLRNGSGNAEDGEEKLEITRTPVKIYTPILLVTAGLFIAIGVILSYFTDSTVPWADAFTTALSVIALWMLSRKYLEQWLVWLVADVGCAILYVYKELWFTGGLYLLYSIIAIFGYLKWKKLMNVEV